MADTVQVLMERMIPELEDLQEKKLFSADEIHQIVERRREFEYIMRRVPLRVVDGLRYIEYELNVDALRKKRKARLALVKMSLSDTAGAKRVHAIFDRLLYKHRGNVDLWLQYISFCMTEGSTRVLSHVFTRALQSHPRSSELWIEAASFEFSENLSVDSARVLMQRAIRINRQDPKLWLEYFRLELLYIQKLSVRREVLRLDGEDAETRTPTEDASVLLEELPEETETGTTDGLTTEEIAAATEKQRTRAMVLDGAIPRIIFQNAVKAIPNDMAFRLQFVAIADLFGRRFAANLSQFILDACATDFPMSELVHATKALRPFLTAETVDEAEREAVALFEQSVATLPTVTMKEKFVEWLVDRLASPDKTPYLLAYATKTIKQYVDDQEVVSVEICTTYIDFVARTEGSAAAVRAAHEILALKRYEACAALWLLHSQLVLHPHSHDDDHEKRATKRRRSTEAKSSTHHHKKQPLEESAGILRDALKHVDGEDADGRFAVWIRLLELLVADAHSTPSAIDAAFQDALKTQRVGSENWNTLREQHHVWASAARPVDAVRVLYKSYMENGQLLPSASTQAFLLRCIDFESSLLAAQVQVDRVRVLFEKLIDLFGKRDEDVWIAYVAFFRDHARFADANAVLHRAQRIWKDSPRLLQLAH